MKQSTSKSLEVMVREECQRQRDNWFNKYTDVLVNLHSEELTEDTQIPRQFKDEFPAVVAGCQDIPSNVEMIGCSGCHTTKWNPDLKDAFQLKLGGSIGSLSPNTGCSFPIGNCAEQHAANKVLNKLNGRGIQHSLQNLAFSKAIRPRTMIEISYCSNCTTLFS